MMKVLCRFGVVISLATSLATANAGEIGSSFGSAADKAWGGVKSGSKQMWDGVSEGGKEAWEATKEGSGELWDTTKRGSSDLWQATKEGVGQAGDSIGEAISGDQ
jgi:hypothetical protein